MDYESKSIFKRFLELFTLSSKSFVALVEISGGSSMKAPKKCYHEN